MDSIAPNAAPRFASSLRIGTRAGVEPGRPSRESVALADICQQAIDEASIARPGHAIELERWSDAQGSWESERIRELLGHLLANALDHGVAGKTVLVSVIELERQAIVGVANFGGPVPPSIRDWLYDSNCGKPALMSGHSGLSIVKETVRSLGARIQLTTDRSATVFYVWLPRSRGNDGSRAQPALKQK